MPERENEVDLEQQNVGPSSEAGGGEWPSPDAPSTGPASGESSRSPGEPQVMPTGTDTQADRQQTGEPGGDRGAARSSEVEGVDPPSGFKDVLEAEPVLGGSSSTPHDDIPEDRQSSPDPSTGGP